MKKFYLLLLAVICFSFAANAQFYEDFDGITTPGGIGVFPAGWGTFDEDGNIVHSSLNHLSGSWDVINYSSMNGDKVAVSTSYYSSPAQSDDWLVTPQINVPTTSPFLVFEIMAPAAPTYADDYEVLISTTGNTPTDFSTVIHSDTSPPDTMTPIAVDLSTYAGQQVYIAFRNVANDEYTLYIGKVEVTSIPTMDDVAITDIELPAYSATNTNNNLEITLKNWGGNVINSVDIEWTDGATTHTYNAAGLNLTTFNSTTITHGTPVNYSTVEEKNISITAVTVNGVSDPNTGDNSTSTPFNTVSQVPTKHVVIEEGTGTWCGWCPRGVVAMEYMYANPNLFPNFIGIAVHNGDPMVVPEYDNGVNLSGYPGCNVNRVLMGQSVNQNIWEDFYNSQKDVVSPVNVGITTGYNDATREITASLTADVYTNFAQADLRFSVVVVEDGVTGTSGGYAQVNYYAGGGEGPMGGYESLPNPVPASQMVYDRVGIALLGGYNGQAGSIPAAITDGSTYNFNFTYTLPNDVDASEVSLVALVLDNNTGAILNAAEVDPGLNVVENPVAVKDIQVYPNPASEVMNISFGMKMPNDVNLNIYNTTGALVKSQNFQNLNGDQSIQVDISGLSPGTYLVSLSTDQGAVVKNVIVK